MSWRIEKIEIENLKFYADKFILNPERQNVLIFGENGAGKSSIYWSIYTHFQAVYKSAAEAQKYFISSHPQNLRNRFSDPVADSGICLSFSDGNGNVMSFEDSNTHLYTDNPNSKNFIEISSRISDFLNYKLISCIFDFKNSEDNDIFAIMLKEAFPMLDFSVELSDLDGIPMGTFNVNDWWNFLNNYQTILPRNAKKPNTFNQNHSKYRIYETYMNGFRQRE